MTVRIVKEADKRGEFEHEELKLPLVFNKECTGFYAIPQYDSREFFYELKNIVRIENTY